MGGAKPLVKRYCKFFATGGWRFREKVGVSWREPGYQTTTVPLRWK